MEDIERGFIEVMGLSLSTQISIYSYIADLLSSFDPYRAHGWGNPLNVGLRKQQRYELKSAISPGLSSSPFRWQALPQGLGMPLSREDCQLDCAYADPF